MPGSVAIDTHIRSFLASAGISLTDDREAGRIVAEAAGLLSISPAQLDASIWAYRARSVSLKH
jgi:predicted nuclease of restriction endonuclease-like RecB superfamily